MRESNQYDRLRQKGLEGQFLGELQHGYELSPRESEGILELVKLVYRIETNYYYGKPTAKTSGWSPLKKVF